MSELKSKLWNGRSVKEEKTFTDPGGWRLAYADALTWMFDCGFTFGEVDELKPIGFIKGDYKLPLKWSKMSKSDKDRLDGVVVMANRDKGEVKLVLFSPKTIL